MRGELIAARSQLLTCAQRQCPELVSNDCTLWLSEVEASLSSIVFAVDDSSGKNLVDVRVSAGDRVLTERTDGRALDIDPGSYQLRFEAEGYRPLTLDVTVRQSEKDRIVRAQLEPIAGASVAEVQHPVEAPSPAGFEVPTLTWVLGGVALASLGTGVYFAVSGHDDYNELKNGCGRDHTCTHGDVEAGKRAYVIADVAFGVGAASAIAAAIILSAAQDDSTQEPADSRVSLSPQLLRGGAYLQWTLRE